jgi:protein TonB
MTRPAAPVTPPCTAGTGPRTAGTGQRTARAYRRLLETYAAPPARERSRGDRRFGGLLAGSLAACLALGYAALGVEVPTRVESLRSAARKATFVLSAPAPRPAPAAEPLAPPPQREPEDLTQNPLLRQTETRATEWAEEPADPSRDETGQTATHGEQEEPRPVYGLRRIYARGLGNGTSGGSGLITKRGNTLAKAPDSLLARPEDLAEATDGLAAELVPLSQVSRAPELVHRVRPAYTQAMLENRVEGVVKARLLVDADGTVEAVEMIDDLGHGSREAALAAFRELRFRPALRGDDPVAAWIVMKYRFVLQE